VSSRNPIPVPRPLYIYVNWAAIALNLFFVLSGFLITLLLLRESSNYGRISLRGFYQRRILRIVPASVTFLIAVFLLQLTGVLAISNHTWLGALTYSINFRLHSCWELGHFWSLSVEEHFYLIWPIIFAVFGLAGGRWTVAICILFAPIMRYVSNRYFTSYLDVEHITFNWVDVIAFGAGLAFLCQSATFCKLSLRLQPICGWLLISSCLGLVASSWLSLRSWRYDALLHPTITGFLCAMLIYLSAAFSNKWVKVVLDWRPLTSLGLVSYSIYIWQELFTGKSGLPLWFSTFPQNLLFIAFAGALSYYLIERPFMRIKDRKQMASVARPERQLVGASPNCLAS